MSTETNSTNPANAPVKDKKEARPSIWEIYYPCKLEAHRDVVYVASFPEIVLFWPLLLICYFCALTQGLGLLTETASGWVFITALAMNLIVLVQDFDQKQFTIFVLIILTALLGVWVINLYGFSFLTTAVHWLLSFNPVLSIHAYLLIGAALLVLIVWGLIAPLFNYWRFEQNEFVHYTQPIGRDMSISRVGCTVHKEIPDVFQCILTLGGGSLIVKRDNQTLAQIHNVPFLGQRMDAIEDMLSETRVTVADNSHGRS